MTGEFGTDASDAAASGIFNVRERVWADEVIERLSFRGRSSRNCILGADRRHAKRSAANELGLTAGIPVSVGCADQPAQAVGNGLIDPPLGSVTIGTGGQALRPWRPRCSIPQLRLHTFCHAPEARWYLLGAMLSAGMALRWLRETLGSERWSYAQMDEIAAEVEPGSEGLVFLPIWLANDRPLWTREPKEALSA